jgi:hypothetical protein
MQIETPLHTDHQLDQLAGQFEHWRRTRSHPSARLPKRLWQQAAALARVLPYSRVAQHVRVSPSDRKKHLATPRDSKPATSPRCVEVPPTLAGAPATQGMEMERERPDGARLRLRCSESPSSVTAWGQAFLEGARCFNSAPQAASFWPPTLAIFAKVSRGAPPCADSAWATPRLRALSTSCATVRAPRSPFCSTTARAIGSG